MRGPGEFVLADARGRPFDDRLAGVLRRLAPQLRREFPALADDLDLTEVLEEAGQRIASREQSAGPILSLYRYAWITVRNVATSRMRRLSRRVMHDTFSSKAGTALLRVLPSSQHTPRQIEAGIMVREAMALLTVDEANVSHLKYSGVSSKEIASVRGCTVEAVDAVFHRAKLKMAKVLGVRPKTHVVRRAR